MFGPFYTYADVFNGLVETIKDINKQHIEKKFFKEVYLDQLLGNNKNIDRRKFSQQLWQLRRSGFIKEFKKGEKLYICLTSKAKLALLEKEFNHAKKMKGKQYLVVAFDVPEAHKHVRNTLRRFLKEHHFVQMQKSVWATSYDVYNQLCRLVKENEAQDWANIFIVSGSLVVPRFKLKK